MTATARRRGEPLAIICGGGSFPGAVAEAVERRGRRPVLFPCAAGPIRRWSSAIRITGSRSARPGASSALRAPKAAATWCSSARCCGRRCAQLRLDWQTLRLLPRIVRVFRGGDDHLLSGIAALFEERGLAHRRRRRGGAGNPGARGRARPLRRHRSAIAPTSRAALALHRRDRPVRHRPGRGRRRQPRPCGRGGRRHRQYAGARRRSCAARDGSPTPPGVGVLVKAPKPGQDRRFDLPAIGPQTVEEVARAGLAGSRSSPAARSSPSPTRSMRGRRQREDFRRWRARGRRTR